MDAKENVIGVDGGDYESVVYHRFGETFETVVHTPIDLKRWFDTLETPVVFAVECSQNAFAREALRRGFRVFVTSPLQASLMRRAQFVSGRKDDKTDAQIHADTFVRFPEMFRPVDLESEHVASLRLISNWRDQMVTDRISAVNQLRALLKDVFPGLHAMRLQLRNIWVLELLLDAPTAEEFDGYDDATTLQRLSKKLDIDVSDVHKHLANPSAIPSPFTCLCADKVRFLAQQTLDLVLEIKRCEKRLTEICNAIDAELRDGLTDENAPTAIESLRSFPMMGPMTLSRLIAEYPEILSSPDAKSLRAYSGASPVTKQSGGSRFVHMRYSRNKRLQTALCLLARNSRRSNARMSAIYARQRARGKREFVALRSMTRPIINTLCALVNNGTIYDEKRNWKPCNC